MAAEAARIAAETARMACMTVEAKANPDRVCGKCDGLGRLDWFSHVKRGTCFWCNGSGVIRRKRGA